MTPGRCQDPMIKGRRRALRWRLLRFGVGFPLGRHFLSSSLSLFLSPSSSVRPLMSTLEAGMLVLIKTNLDDRLYHPTSIFVKSKDALDSPAMIRCSRRRTTPEKNKVTSNFIAPISSDGERVGSVESPTKKRSKLRYIAISYRVTYYFLGIRFYCII